MLPAIALSGAAMDGLALAMAVPLAAAALHDLRHRLVPDGAVLALALLGCARTLGLGGDGLVAGLAAGSLPALLAGLVRLWGWGDVKLMAAAGLAAGPDIGRLWLATALAGGLLALLLVLMRPLARRTRPRGPRWLVREARRLRVAPSVPYAVAIAAGLASVLAGS